MPDEQTKDRRHQIIDAARDTFVRNGLEGAKTRQIADAAGVTETQLYRHFRSKQELFEMAILDRVEELTAELLKLASDFPRATGKDRFKLSEQVHRDLIIVMGEISPLLGVALFSDRAAGKAFWQGRLSPLIDQASDALWMPREATQIIDPRTMLLVYIGMFFGLAVDSNFRAIELDVDRLARDVTKLVAFGIFPPAAPSSRKSTAAKQKG